MRHVHRVKREASQAPAQQPEQASARPPEPEPRVKAARTPKDGAVAPEAREQGTGQAAPPETPEQRERRAYEDALEFSRLRAAVYHARTDDEARIAREELDTYVRRETERHGSPEEKESEKHSRSRGLGRSL